MAKTTAMKKVIPYHVKRFGVVNHFGDIWTSDTFSSAEAAQIFLDMRREQYPHWKLGRHRVVPVRLTVKRA